MNKRGIIVLLIAIVLIVVTVVVCLVSCGACSTPRAQVYELITTNKVVKNARDEEADYSSIIEKYKTTTNAPELYKVNELSKLTTSIIDELTNNVLFVRNTNVSDKKVQKAYEEYIEAKNFANKKLQEALTTSPNADWVAFLATLTDRYGKQTIKYSAFASELLNYVNEACFENNPKTVKHTTLSFIQGLYNYAINDYITNKKLNNYLVGIPNLGVHQSEIALLTKYNELKSANKENIKKEALLFVEGFYSVDNINGIYAAYCKGADSLRNYVNDATTYTGSTSQNQKTAHENVYKFIALDSFVA